MSNKKDSPQHSSSQQGSSPPAQRKTTLKWTSHGELSEVDMARILEKLEDSSLIECELTCDLD